ncbi:hypothetical protein HWB76_gp127 [Streptomyces phage Blueeyedbeauty]|uniref:Uncharacterized protein n=1 Tax=Streptomyces phage Blueeyedbeauty TaxID=2250336 RepID=A0A345L1X3_9CAUD|nr:hypothetical protein HWB76_gp127 [Streptomyces phage Blueeyedbeauty]AXH49275.1 hypothetical protein SEA_BLUEEYEDBEAUTY_159 [Streptomyces phage Blueeyedbeauty]
MAGLPKKLYYVLVKPGGTPLKYRQKGGGTYTNEKFAKSQYESLKTHGSRVELYSTELEWKLEETSTNPMEGMPGLW